MNISGSTTVKVNKNEKSMNFLTSPDSRNSYLQLSNLNLYKRLMKTHGYSNLKPPPIPQEKEKIKDF